LADLSHELAGLVGVLGDCEDDVENDDDHNEEADEDDEPLLFMSCHHWQCLFGPEYRIATEHGRLAI